jgi:hypothetical protein
MDIYTVRLRFKFVLNIPEEIPLPTNNYKLDEVISGCLKRDDLDIEGQINILNPDFDVIGYKYFSSSYITDVWLRTKFGESIDKDMLSILVNNIKRNLHADDLFGDTALNYGCKQIIIKPVLFKICILPDVRVDMDHFD